MCEESVGSDSGDIVGDPLVTPVVFQELSPVGRNLCASDGYANYVVEICGKGDSGLEQQE